MYRFVTVSELKKACQKFINYRQTRFSKSITDRTNYWSLGTFEANHYQFEYSLYIWYMIGNLISLVITLRYQICRCFIHITNLIRSWRHKALYCQRGKNRYWNTRKEVYWESNNPKTKFKAGELTFSNTTLYSIRIDFVEYM